MLYAGSECQEIDNSLPDGGYELIAQGEAWKELWLDIELS